MIFHESAKSRLSMIGGGIDIPEVFSREKIAIFQMPLNLSTDLYVKISKNPLKIPTSEFIYSEVEKVHHPNELKHKGYQILFDEIIKVYPNSRVQAISFADVKVSSGLGTSGAFYVNLEKILSRIKKINSNWVDIARSAFEKERKNSELSCGIQDHLSAAYGKAAIFMLDGSKVEVIKTPKEFTPLLNSKIFLMDLNVQASSYDNFQEGLAKINPKEYLSLNQKFQQKLKDNELKFQCLISIIRELWDLKKSTENIDPLINSIEKEAIQDGAYFCRICGSGSRGYLAVAVPSEKEKLFLQKYKNFLLIQEKNKNW